MSLHPTITALDKNGQPLESYDLAATAPISTPSAENQGGFRGIVRDQADIYGFSYGNGYLVLTNLTFTNPPMTGVDLAASPASPQRPGTQVIFTATGFPEGQSYEYRFSLHDPEAGWTVKQEYGAPNAWDWNPSGAEGSYEVRVEARVAGSGVTYDAKKEIPYTLTEPTDMSPILPLILEEES